MYIMVTMMIMMTIFIKVFILVMILRMIKMTMMIMMTMVSMMTIFIKVFIVVITRQGSIRSSPRNGLSTPYKMTTRNSARLFHHVLFNM